MAVPAGDANMPGVSCILCEARMVLNGEMHDAVPVAVGRCCATCNLNAVLPARIIIATRNAEAQAIGVRNVPAPREGQWIFVKNPASPLKEPAVTLFDSFESLKNHWTQTGAIEHYQTFDEFFAHTQRLETVLKLQTHGSYQCVEPKTVATLSIVYH